MVALICNYISRLLLTQWQATFLHARREVAERKGMEIRELRARQREREREREKG